MITAEISNDLQRIKDLHKWADNKQVKKALEKLFYAVLVMEHKSYAEDNL